MMKLRATAGAAAVVAALLLSLSGCQKPEGPAERAGKEIDKTATQAGQAIDKAGEKVGAEVEKAGEKLKDASRREQK